MTALIMQIVPGALFVILQGSQSVADYAVEFRTLSIESGWNEPALFCAFCRGLNDLVCDTRVAGARTKDLAKMVERAIELDNYQRERRRELFFHSSSSFQPFQPLFVDSHSASEEPMQLRGAQLSPAKRRRCFTSDSYLYG